MGNWDWSQQKLYKQAANPAAPRGLQQTSQRLAQNQQNYDRGAMKLRPWMPENSMMETAKSWYTGANSQGTENGWNTPFYAKAQQQQADWMTKAAAQGKSSVYFGWLDPKQNKDATGVSTWGAAWDDEEAKRTGAARLGDVYENGKRVANLYDDFDKATADVMVGEFMFSRTDKAAMFKNQTIDPATGRPKMGPEYAKAVEEERVRNSKMLSGAAPAEAFNANIERREAELRTQDADENVILGGAVSGAIMGGTYGAIAGSALPGIGNLIAGFGGAVVGGAVGGIGAYLNQDQIIYTAARAQEKADITNKQFDSNWQAKVINGGEYAGVAMKFISPATNLWQGSYDAYAKEGASVGDMSSEFYKVDAEGNREASGLVRGVDVVASVADGAAQFSSPVGMWSYMISTGGVVAGGAAELTTGTKFDDRTGRYDDLQGAKEWGGAIGSVAIDAAQFGIAGGFSKAQRALRKTTTGEASFGGVAKRVGYGGNEKAATALDRAWTATQKAVDSKVLGRSVVSGKAVSAVESAGMRFVKNEAGEVLSARPTVAMIAPSEHLRWLPAGYNARRLAAQDGGEMTRDHLLKSAIDLQKSTGFRNAVLMGFTEGSEEGAQTVLDAMSLGEWASGEDVVQAMIYGAAGGVGMALGPNNRGVSKKQTLERRAYSQWTMRNGYEPSPEEWKEITNNSSPDQLKRIAATNAKEDKETAAVHKQLTDNMRHDKAKNSSIGFARMEQMSEARSQQLHKKALAEGHGSLVLKGQSSEFLTTSKGTVEGKKFSANAGVMSAFETVNQINLIAEGHAAQLKKVSQELEAIPQDAPNAADLLTERTARKAELTEQAKVSRAVADDIRDIYTRFTQESKNPADWDRHLSLINNRIMDGYTGAWLPGTLQADADTMRRVKKALEVKLGRHPYQDKGSFTVVVPQISTRLTELDAHNEMYVQQGLLEAMHGDHDGDTVVTLHEFWEDEDTIERLRRGDQYMQIVEEEVTEGPGKGGPKRQVVEVIAANPDSEMMMLEDFAEAMLMPKSLSARTVNDAVDTLITAIRDVYAAPRGPINLWDLDALLGTFKDEVTHGRVDARKNLVTGMVNANYEGMRNFKNPDRVANVQWLWAKISERWDVLQKDLCLIRANEIVRPTIEPGQEAQETTVRSTISRLRAATSSAALGLITSNPVRGAQHLYYSNFVRSMTYIDPKATMTTQQQLDLTKQFLELGSEQYQRDIERVNSRHAITDRVEHWLQKMVETSGQSITHPEAILLLANTRVPVIQMNTINEYQVEKEETTMLQLLLQRSLDMEKAQHQGIDPDSDVAREIRRLERLTHRDQDRSKHSTTASLAMVEVFRNKPLYKLAGTNSAYISPQITLGQIIDQQIGMSKRDRDAQNHRFIRCPGYIKDTDRTYGDPPWPMSVLADDLNNPDQKSPPVNAFAMLVDAMKVASDTHYPRLESRDKTIQKEYADGLKGLHARIDAYRRLHDTRLSKEKKTGNKVAILEEMLENDYQLARELATLIPDAAALGVFQVHEDNTVTAQEWLMEMLVEENVEQAIATYYLQIKLAQWNQLQGTVDREELSRLQRLAKDKDAPIDPAKVRGEINPANLDSRFLQMMYNLASQPGQIQLDRFLSAMHKATSVDEMFEMINKEPMWRNNQANLLPWHDDVSDFFTSINTTWNSEMPGSTQRENITAWSKKMVVQGKIALEQAVNYEGNRGILHSIHQYIKTKGREGGQEGAQYFELLGRAIRNRRLFPDTQGQAVRQQLDELQMRGLAAVQNKGAADDRAAPYGDPLITMDSFGYSDGLRQEIASVTSEDVEDILTNLTLLTDGPVRITLEDGSYFIFDITTEAKALEMLMDPRTQGLAIAVLFPTVRDVNDYNVVQTYLDTDAQPANDKTPQIAKLLKEQTFKGLYDDQPDFASRLRQAHRVIGFAEGYVRKQALGSTDPDVIEKSFMPIKQMVHDFLTVYIHTKDVKESEYDRIRDQLYIDISDALKTVSSVKGENRVKLKDLITKTMLARLDDTQLEDLQNGDHKKSVIALKLLERQTEQEDAILAQYDTRIAAAKTDAERLQLEAEAIRFLEFQLQKGITTKFPSIKKRDAVSAMKMFEIRGPNPDAIRISQAEIMAFLGTQGRYHKLELKNKYDFKDPVTGKKITVNGQQLYMRFLRRYSEDPLHPPDFSMEEWRVLGSWAAELYIIDSTVRASTDVPATGAFLGEDGAAVQRYFDPSFSYLIDTLFDDKVMEAMDLLSVHGEHFDETNRFDAEKKITNGLLNENRIGTWTQVIPNEALKTRMVLKNSTVGAAIQQEGNDPKVMADYVGGGRVTFEKPRDEHFSEFKKQGTWGQGLGELLDNMDHVKLGNHFVRNVTIQSTDPTKQLPPNIANILGKVTHANATNTDTEAAGDLNSTAPLRVLNLQKLSEEIEFLKQNPATLLGDYEITIEYVDVHKKPHTREWANNIYFDGAGREARGGSTLGAVASLFFGLGALNKVGQQEPLDAATKAGKSFRPHKRSSLQDVLNLEQPGKSIAQILADKTAWIMKKEFPTGELMQTDLPSIFKLMKMRHVMVGKDANGNKKVMWSEEYIQKQEANEAIDMVDPVLVSLSDRVAQTLWGKSGTMGVRGTRGSMTKPTFNIADLDIFPDLSQERLERLGFDRLGEKADVGNSRLAQVAAPPRAVAKESRGKGPIPHWLQQLTAWQGQAQSIHTQRSSDRRTGEGKFDIDRINRKNLQSIIDMLSTERQGLRAQGLGIPIAGVTDFAAMEASYRVAYQAVELMESENSMIWVYKHGPKGDLASGAFGRADIDNNFAGLGGKGPTYGDIVVVDLTEIQNATSSVQEAADRASEILKTLSEKGLTVALQSSQGQLDLRAEVAERLTNGSVGYRAFAGSGHFFVPITAEPDTNAAQRASSRTLVETEQWRTKNMATRVITDNASTNLTENTEYVDVAHDRAMPVISHTVIPGRMTGSPGPGGQTPLSFNAPMRGDGRADQLNRINAYLSNLLKNPDGRKYIKSLFNVDKGQEEKYPEYVVHPNGTTEHGIVPLDKALDLLEQTVDANKWALDEQEVFQWGTIVPIISGDNSIHLRRIGFKPPDVTQMWEQRQKTFNDEPMKLTVDTSAIDNDQTLPPPTVVTEFREDDDLGWSIIGETTAGSLPKSTDEGIGYKAGQVPMPSGYSFPDVVIAAPGAAGNRPSRIASYGSLSAKEGLPGTINNFRNGFMYAGIDFRDDMIDFFFGEDPIRKKEDRDELWDVTQKILKMWAAYPHPYNAEELSRMLDIKGAVVEMEARLNMIGKEVYPDLWNGVRLNWGQDSGQTPLSRLGTIMLATLAAEGVKLEHVISTAGLTTVKSHDGESLVRQMPALMTNALDDLQYPELRKMLMKRINRNMPVDAQGKALYWFDDRWQFHAAMNQETEGGTRQEVITGFLQIHVPVKADENSLRLTYSGVNTSGPESKHIADVVASALGSRLMTKPKKPSEKQIPDVLEEMYSENEIQRFKSTDPQAAAASFSHMFRRLKTGAPGYTPWMNKTPMEEEHLEAGVAKVKQYSNYRGVKDETTGWSTTQVTDGKRLARSFLSKLNITDESMVNEVEYLVRQLFGIPGPAPDQTDYHEHLTFEAYQAGIEYMMTNLRNNMHPLDGGKVPMEHQFFWKMVFDAQKKVAPGQKWVPLKTKGKVKEYADPDNWGEWISTLHGQVRASDKMFDATFRTDLDGFYHTYQGTHPDYMEMAVSTEQMITAKLLHPDTNREFMSVDPGYDAVLKDPIMLASRNMNYDALVGKGSAFNADQAEDSSISVWSKRHEAMKKWQAGEKLPKQKDLSVMEYARMGAAYQESQRNTSMFFRNLINMTLINRLLNPALYASAVIEVPFRSALELATNLMTGQATGVTGRVISGTAEALNTVAGKVGLQGFNLQPAYTTDDLVNLNSLNTTMGESNHFLGRVHNELAYTTVIAGATGRFGKGLEWLAGKAARITGDPRWGMKAYGLARRYNDAAWQHLMMTNSIINMQQYCWYMQNDPGWLEREYPEADRMGMNAVQQARGAKNTMLGNTLMRPIEAMAKSDNWAFNCAGHLLKIPFIFTRFNGNMFLTLTGLHGLDQAIAMFFGGKAKPRIIRHLERLVKQKRGAPPFDPQPWDTSDVIETLDLTRTFVRGQITVTSLMAAGMMASGLGLDGEDEEARRQRRMSEYLNVPYYHDPRKAANDFRWKDAIFLDSVPLLDQKNETGHAAVVPHWIVKQFLSPVLGVMRFYETGDASEIGAGFHEAAAVMPNSIARIWAEADLTHELLLQAAAEDELVVEKQSRISQLLLNSVWVYEKALFENAFINGLYVARDDYDRNPWAVPEFNDAGGIVPEQGTGQPKATPASIAFKKEGATEDEDSSRIAYMTRRGRDAMMHQYTEGNASAALMLSVLPFIQGDESTYLRGNMVTKKERVQLNTSTKDQIEELVFASYRAKGGQDFLTKEEIIGGLKLRDEKAGKYWKQHEIEAEADAVYKQQKNSPLSVFDNSGKEIQTIDGKAAVFRSLEKGVINLDSPQIQGFNMSQGERDEIAKEITEELMQEGIDQGLSHQSAQFRMRRIWYGDKTNPALPGMSKILYDKRIPDKAYAEYDRQNVTYTPGPDGKPWATPFMKSTVLQVLGIPFSHHMPPTIPNVTSYDQRGNVIDLVRGINTGQAGLVPRPIASEIKPNKDVVDAAAKKEYTPGGKSWKRFPWRNFGRRRFGGFGGGGGGYGGGGGGGAPFFQRMQPLPDGTSARIDDIPMINTNNPIIRRADVRRERVTSERGRLKQWQ